MARTHRPRDIECVKSALTNQAAIAGIGNVYADEILFQAKLHPQTVVSRLNRSELRRLCEASRRILQTAARNGGGIEQLSEDYLSAHRDTDGNCPRCGRRLAQVKVNSRTTYLCPTCQPLPGNAS